MSGRMIFANGAGSAKRRIEDRFAPVHGQDARGTGRGGYRFAPGAGYRGRHGRAARATIRGGFTLIEMLLATVLASILMGGVLVAAAALSRERVRMEAKSAAGRSSGAFEMIRRDLSNGVAVVGSPDAFGFEVIGFGGVDGKTFLPNQRLVRVRYRVVRDVRDVRGGMLVRDQAYLDDPVRVDRWSDVAAIGAGRINIVALSNDGEVVKLGDEVGERLRSIDRSAAIPSASRVPSRVRVRIEYSSGADDCDMVLR